MVETIVQLKPPSEWPSIHHERWYSSWAPSFLKRPLSGPGPTKCPAWAALIGRYPEVHPGLNNAWTMPIKTRVDMLTTGVRTPVGIKVFGRDLKSIEVAGEQLGSIPAQSAWDAQCSLRTLARRNVRGRGAQARSDRWNFGLQVGELNAIIERAIGGEPITTTVEGRERYTVNVRYKEDSAF